MIDQPLVTMRKRNRRRCWIFLFLALQIAIVMSSSASTRIQFLVNAAANASHGGGVTLQSKSSASSFTVSSTRSDPFTTSTRPAIEEHTNSTSASTATIDSKIRASSTRIESPNTAAATRRRRRSLQADATAGENHDRRNEFYGTALTSNGYDTALGEQAICWRGRVISTAVTDPASDEGNQTQRNLMFSERPKVIENCAAATTFADTSSPPPSAAATKLEQPNDDETIKSIIQSTPFVQLNVWKPNEAETGERLRTQQVYSYQIQLSVNMARFRKQMVTYSSDTAGSTISTSPLDYELLPWADPGSSNDDSAKNGSDGTDHGTIAVQLILCSVQIIGFCSPFVHDQAIYTSSSSSSASSGDIKIVGIGYDDDQDDEDETYDLHGGTHYDSGWMLLNATDPTQQQLLLQEQERDSPTATTPHIDLALPEHDTVHEFLVPAKVPQAGDYFVLATAQFYTGNSITGEVYHRWDIANALPPITQSVVDYQGAGAASDSKNDESTVNAKNGNNVSPNVDDNDKQQRITIGGGRVIRYYDPPIIIEISHGVKLFSWFVTGGASLVIIFLIVQTTIHRKSPVLDLSQADFLIVFLLAALIATLSLFLLEPKNDIYCQWSFPLILIPIQLMYSITAGRLWRINAVISPLLVAHYRKSLKQYKWRGKLVTFLHRMANIGGGGGGGNGGGNGAALSTAARRRSRQRQMKRSIPSWRLAVVIAYFAIPQVIIQICGFLLQPQRRVVIFNDDESIGKAQCSAEGADTMWKSILTYGYATVIVLILILSVMAFSSRKLPSLFNETSVIYEVTLNSIMLIVLGSVIIAVTEANNGATASNITSSPDVRYLVWITVILSITLGSSCRLMLPKLKMVWKGETVIVSKLVSDHHRKHREKTFRKDNRNSELVNVTGLNFFEEYKNNKSGMSSGGSGLDDGPNGNTNHDSDSTNMMTLGGSYSFTGGTNIFGSFGSDFPADTGEGSETGINDGSFSNNDGEDEIYPIAPVEGGPPLARTSKKPRKDTGNKKSFLFPAIKKYRAASEDETLESSGAFERPNSRADPLEDADTEPDEVPTSSTVEPQGHSDPTNEPYGDQSSKETMNEESGSNCKDGKKIALLRSKQADNENLLADRLNLVMKGVRRKGTSRSPRGGGRGRQDRIPNRRPVVTLKLDETPPRRLVLKMVDLQEALTTMNSSIMTGLVVTPRQWEEFSAMVTKLEKIFREDIEFSWQASNGHDSDSDADLGVTLHGKASSSGMGDEESEEGLSMTERLEATEKVSRRGFLQRARSAVGLDARFDDNKADVKKDVSAPKRVSNLTSADVKRIEASNENANRERVCRSVLPTRLKDVAKIFREIVDVRDRKHNFMTYNDVFIGRDAVDAILYAGLADTRDYAVELGRQLSRELHIFKHVTGEHAFEDKHLFYKFLDEDDSWDSFHGESDDKSLTLDDIEEKNHPDELAKAFREVVKVGDRRYRMKLYQKVFVGSEAVDALVYNNVAATRWEAVQLGRKLARKPTSLFHHVCGDHEFKDAHLFYHYHEHEDVVEISARSSEISSERPRKRNPLVDKADAFKMYVDVRDRRFRMMTYKKCFVGSEAVDALLYAGVASTREEAVEVGRSLETELRLFKPVNGDYGFKDENVLYRFREVDGGGQKRSDHDSLNSSFTADQLNVSKTGESLNASHSQSTAEEVTSKHSESQEKIQAFKRIVQVGTRTYHMRKYREVFVGSEAVDAIVYNGLANSRREAVQLGRAIERDGLFKHVTGDHAFSDDFLFFRYRNVADDSISTLGNSMSEVPSVGLSQLTTFPRRNELAEKAEAFRNCVDVRDRKHKVLTYKRCFVAAEAVDAMIFSGLAKTRTDAVALGRKLAAELRLFESVRGDMPFCDEQYFYRFRDEDGDSNSGNKDGSSKADSTSKKDMESFEAGDLAERLEAFKKCVTVRNRTYRMRVYHSVFVGQEAVDAMVYAGVAGSRKEAVVLGRLFAKEYNLFRHVTGDHAFSDDYLFFRLNGDSDTSDGNSQSISENRSNGRSDRISSGSQRSRLAQNAELFRECADVRDRKYRLLMYKHCFVGSEVVDAMVCSELVKTRADAVELGRKLASELRLFTCVMGGPLFCDDNSFYRFRVIGYGGVGMSADDSVAQPSLTKSQSDGDQLIDKLEEFKQCVTVRNRSYRGKTYDLVFVGEEVVDTLVYRGVVKTRKDAVFLGRLLAKEYNLFSHVCGDHSFCDKFLFYRFTDVNAGISHAGVAGSDVSSKQTVPAGELGSYADAFRRVVDVRDRSYLMQKYKSCFVGSEAVDALVFAGIAATREDAISLARELQKELRLFEHVSTKQPFQGDDSLYRLRENHLESPSDDVESSSDAAGGDSDIRSTMLEIAQKFQDCVVVKDRKYRFRTYKQCFIGHDAIDTMIQKRLVRTRKEGVELGRTLARELGLFKHVCGDHAFCDGYFFYRFCMGNDEMTTTSPGAEIGRNGNAVEIVKSPDGLDGKGRKLLRQPSHGYLELPFGLPAVMESDENEDKDALPADRTSGPTFEDDPGLVRPDAKQGSLPVSRKTIVPSVSDAEAVPLPANTVDLEAAAGDSSTSTEVEITNLAELPIIARRDSDKGEDVEMDLV